MAEYLLDTCAVIWAGNGDKLAEAAVSALNTAWQEGQFVYACPFAAWELGQLVARGRLRLPLPPEKWFEKFLEKGSVHLTDLSPEILVASSFLPATPPRDPADRIVIATARNLGLTIITRDQLILDYAKEGYVSALKC